MLGDEVSPVEQALLPVRDCGCWVGVEYGQVGGSGKECVNRDTVVNGGWVVVCE